jgi:hypothetical protein
VTQASLRRHICIVPQDCVLFNDEYATPTTLFSLLIRFCLRRIGYNIGYGIYARQPEGPTQDQIGELPAPLHTSAHCSFLLFLATVAAARSAAIADFVESQKDKYQTKVGERGLR